MPKTHPLFSSCLVVAALSSAASTALAQRVPAKIEFQDRSAVIEYGAVRYGKHSIDELKPGTPWRMGSGEASVLKTEVPILSGDTVIAPGAYRVAVSRKEENGLYLNLSEALRALSAAGDEDLKGTLTTDKPNKELVVEWTSPAKGKGEKESVRESTVRVQFGPSVLSVPLTIVGSHSLKVAGWTVDVFTIPAELLKKRMEKGVMTPVASLKSSKDAKKAASFNLLLGKDGASLVPAMEVPTDNFGFGPVSPPDQALIKKGKVEVAESKEQKATLEAGKVEKKGSDLSFLLAFGDQTATVVVPEPATAAPPKSGKKQ